MPSLALSATCTMLDFLEISLLASVPASFFGKLRCWFKGTLDLCCVCGQRNINRASMSPDVCHQTTLVEVACNGAVVNRKYALYDVTRLCG